MVASLRTLSAHLATPETHAPSTAPAGTHEPGQSCGHRLRSLRCQLHLARGDFQAASADAAALHGHHSGSITALQARIAGAAATLARVQALLVAHTAPEAVALTTSALVSSPLSVPLRLARAQAALAAGDFLLAGSDASSVLRSVSPGVADAPPEAYTLLARALVHVFPGPRGAGLADAIVRACLHAWGPDQGTCGTHASLTTRATHAWDAAQRAAAANDTEGAAQALAEVAEVCTMDAGPSSPCATAAWAALCALQARAVQRMARGRDAGAGPWATQGLVTCASAMAGLVGNATTVQMPGTAGVVLTARGWARLGTGDAAGGTADVTAARAMLADALLDGTPCLCLSSACEGGDGQHGDLLDVACDAALAWANELEAALQEALAPPDFYMLLNVTSQDARTMGAAEWRDFLRRAYRRAALQWHPDKLSGQPLPPFVTGPEHMFLLLAEAFRVLSDAVLRDDYDAGRPTASSGGSGQPLRRGGAASGAADETESPGGMWVFHFDKRDVDADGTVLGTWVRDADGARRQGRRPTPHPTRPTASTSPSSPDGAYECGPHGARRRRCLAAGAAELQSRAVAEEAGTAGRVKPEEGPDGFSAPLSPAPTLLGRPGCYGVAQMVGNHFGLVAVQVEFTLAPSGHFGDADGADDSLLPESPLRGVKPGYGPRLSPGAIEALAASKRAADVGIALVWTPPSLATQAASVSPGDLLVYELKWLGVDAEGEGGEEGGAEGVPPAYVALDLRWLGGQLLSRTGATDARGFAAGPGVDLRGAMGDEAQAPGGWLERRIVLPQAGVLEAVLFACAAPGRVTVRAALRHVRIESPGGERRLVLLPGRTADLGDGE